MKKTKNLAKKFALALVFSLVLTGCQTPDASADAIPSSVVIEESPTSDEVFSDVAEESSEAFEEESSESLEEESGEVFDEESEVTPDEDEEPVAKDDEKVPAPVVVKPSVPAWIQYVLNVELYKNGHPDLQRVYGYDTAAYVNHYLTIGALEGRTKGVLFDPLAYAAAYPDIAKAYGNDVNGIIQHYVVIGMNEGRTQGTAAGFRDIEAKNQYAVSTYPTGGGGSNTPVATPAPSELPTVPPTSTEAPSAEPTVEPSAEPTATPAAEPTETPAAEPTETPVAEPTETPAAEPTETPVAEPTETPAAEPTETPVAEPTETPAAEPTETPAAEPTETPVVVPSATPTSAPSEELADYYAVLDTPTIQVSDVEQTVVMTIKAKEPVVVDGIGFTTVWDDALTLASITGGNKIGAYNSAATNLNNGIAGWSSPDAENVEDVTDLAVITFTIPANTAAGSYEVGITKLELTKDYGEIWLNEVSVSTILTITGATQ